MYRNHFDNKGGYVACENNMTRGVFNRLESAKYLESKYLRSIACTKCFDTFLCYSDFKS